MKKLIAAVMLVLAAPLVAVAQSVPPSRAPGKATIIVDSKDTVVLRSSPELERAVQDFAAAMQSLALKVATDPKLRSAAIEVASGFINVAQQAVTEQSVVLQEALRNASQKIAAVQAAEKALPRKR